VSSPPTVPATVAAAHGPLGAPHPPSLPPVPSTTEADSLIYNNETRRLMPAASNSQAGLQRTI